ncbi:Charged multivesicular body protein 3 [Dirofilaria immitis]|nr:Charged multivesicular body protein 3 [Dirofilaria immitis]
MSLLQLFSRDFMAGCVKSNINIVTWMYEKPIKVSVFVEDEGFRDSGPTRQTWAFYNSLCFILDDGLIWTGEKIDTKEAVRELQRKMRAELRQLDRQIHAIEREEMKVKKQIKESAKKGDRDVCVVLAKSILQSRKAVSKIHGTKAQINSVVMGMQQQLATVRMAGSLQQSTDVMKNMQQLVKVPEIMSTMRELSKEMMKVGIIDEMMEETMESVEPEELEEEAQEEVDRILYEITAGELGKAPSAVKDALAVESESMLADTETHAVDYDEMRASRINWQDSNELFFDGLIKILRKVRYKCDDDEFGVGLREETKKYFPKPNLPSVKVTAKKNIILMTRQHLHRAIDGLNRHTTLCRTNNDVVRK